MDKNNDSFTTHSDTPVSSVITLAVIMLIVGAVFAFLFYNPEQIRALLIGLAVYAVVCAGFIVYFIFTSRWKLEFTGAELLLTNLGNKKQFRNWDVPVSACVMKCTSKEKDIGSLKITGTVFNIGGIHNFAAMKEYIETHFPQN